MRLALPQDSFWPPPLLVRYEWDSLGEWSAKTSRIVAYNHRQILIASTNPNAWFTWTRSTLHTLHCTLYTPHFSLHTTHSTLHTLNSTLHTLHSTLYTSHSTLYTEHSTFYLSHSTFHTLHSTFYISRSTLHTPHPTLHTQHSTLYTSHCPLHIQTPHAIILHTLHSTIYTSHFLLHHAPHSKSAGYVPSIVGYQNISREKYVKRPKLMSCDWKTNWCKAALPRFWLNNLLNAGAFFFRYLIIRMHARPLQHSP